MKRARGVGTYEFHLNPDAISDIGFTIPVSKGVHLFQKNGPYVTFDKKVYETRPGYLHLVQYPVAVVDVFDNAFGYPAWGFPLARRKYHGHIGCIIAMRSLSRKLHFYKGDVRFLQYSLFKAGIN